MASKAGTEIVAGPSAGAEIEGALLASGKGASDIKQHDAVLAVKAGPEGVFMSIWSH